MSSYSDLIDIVLQKGMKHSDLLHAIHSSVLAAYKNKGYANANTVSVAVDEHSGVVTILEQSVDVTPEEFKKTAQEIAHQTIEHLLKTQETHRVPFWKQHISIWELLFWICNIVAIFIFGAIVMWLAPNTAFLNVLKQISVFQIIYLGLLFAIPAVSVTSALTGKRFQNSEIIERLFIEFEFPLLLLSAVGYFFIALLAPVYQIVCILFIALHGFLFLTSEKHQFPLLRFLFLCWLWVGTVYTNLVFALIGIPAIGGMLHGFFSISYTDLFNWQSSGLWSLIPIVILAVTVAIVLVLLLLNINWILLLYYETKRSYATVVQKIGKVRLALLVTGGSIVGLFILWFARGVVPLGDQGLLLSYASASTYEEKMPLALKILEKEQVLKFAVDRWSQKPPVYLIEPNSNQIQRLYTGVIPAPEPVVSAINALGNWLLRPFAGKNYRSYSQILDEVVVIERIISSEERSLVTLVKRSVSAEPLENGVFARITIEDEFVNTSGTEEEVIQEFSLPTDAVIVGLDLGPDLEFPGIVAPRGAALRTYEQQLIRRRDPALLEQVGPRQYRLRVFPIPTATDPTFQGKNQKVRFSYITSSNKDGYALPVYSKYVNQNIQTAQLRATLANTQVPYAIGDTVLKNSDFVFIQSPLCQAQRTGVASGALQGQRITFVATPETALFCTGNEYKIKEKKKIAVFYDASYDSTNKRDIQPLLNDIAAKKGEATIDMYFFNTTRSSAVRFEDVEERYTPFVYFGKQSFDALLNNLPQGYDRGVIVLSGMPSGMVPESLIHSPYPLVIVHEDGVIPAYTREWMLALIAANVRVFANTAEALSTLAQTPTNTTIAVFPGYRLEQQADIAAREFTTTPVSYIGAKALIEHAWTKEGNEKGSDLVFLDQLHSLAKSAGVVSPTSSLLALVNDQQRVELGQQTLQENRYNTQTDIFRPPQPPFNFMPIPLGIRNPVSSDTISPPSFSLEENSGRLSYSPGLRINGFQELSYFIGSIFGLVTLLLLVISTLQRTLKRIRRKE